MRFHKSTSQRDFIQPSSATTPLIVYLTDGWDDYSYKSLFHLCLIKKNGEKVRLGSAKILQRDKLTSVLPDEFETLSEDFASLGQDPDYYQNIREHLPRTHLRVLGALNDVVVKPKILEEIETTSGFRNSLVRFNDAKICLRDGLAILQGQQREAGYTFSYTGEIPGADEGVTVSLDMKPSDAVPGRVVAIIGRNGVGKTQFLAKMARDLADTKRISKEKKQLVEDAFKPRRPLFSRVIALSFSAFDRFERPQPRQFFSYIYCGVRDDIGGLSRKALDARHLGYLRRVKEHGRSSEWEEHVSRVLGQSPSLVSLTKTISEIESGLVPSMSSGQSILIHFISAALAYLKSGSLVLFDEPEIHLHPNAVALLMQTLQSLLIQFDSYAILATHSPVVIQDVPRKHVIKFERAGNQTTSYPLAEESFGESISELTRIVFETIEAPSFYKQTLKDLAKSSSYRDVCKMFDDKLSLHASAYLLSQYGD